ncbi:MAG: ABC transporter substrate-binding protein [candidate division NC10 bacterium]|nr:ABC transporter substrate-binding protein [candidate division NC10 bacterium]
MDSRHLTLAVALFSALGSACGQEASAPALEPTSVVLKWHHQTQFAGVYVAQFKEFYRKHALAVRIDEGSFKVSPIQGVASGENDFGITSQTQFLIERAKGQPIVAVAAIYQKSPVGFFALDGSGITRPRDFRGKTVAYAPTHEIHFKALLKRAGLDLRQIRTAPYGYDLTPWYTGRVQVWAGYVMNQPVDARLAGHEVKIIFPDDYGIHTYDDILFVSEQLLQQRPSLIERFLRATLQGWRYAIEHPDEATELTLRVEPKLVREKQLAMLRASTPLIHTGQDPIGWMRREIWQEAQGLLLEQRLLPAPVDLGKAYTLQFLQAIYRETAAGSS